MDIPQDTDEATNHLLEEMADLWERMCDKHIKPAITERDYKGHWGRMKEIHTKKKVFEIKKIWPGVYPILEILRFCIGLKEGGWLG